MTGSSETTNNHSDPFYPDSSPKSQPRRPGYIPELDDPTCRHRLIMNARKYCRLFATDDKEGLRKLVTDCAANFRGQPDLWLTFAQYIWQQRERHLCGSYSYQELLTPLLLADSLSASQEIMMSLPEITQLLAALNQPPSDTDLSRYIRQISALTREKPIQFLRILQLIINNFPHNPTIATRLRYIQLLKPLLSDFPIVKDGNIACGTLLQAMAICLEAEYYRDAFHHANVKTMFDSWVSVVSDPCQMHTFLGAGKGYRVKREGLPKHPSEEVIHKLTIIFCKKAGLLSHGWRTALSGDPTLSERQRLSSSFQPSLTRRPPSEIISQYRQESDSTANEERDDLLRSLEIHVALLLEAYSDRNSSTAVLAGSIEFVSKLVQQIHTTVGQEHSVLSQLPAALTNLIPTR